MFERKIKPRFETVEQGATHMVVYPGTSRAMDANQFDYEYANQFRHCPHGRVSRPATFASADAAEAFAKHVAYEHQTSAQVVSLTRNPTYTVKREVKVEVTRAPTV